MSKDENWKQVGVIHFKCTNLFSDSEALLEQLTRVRPRVAVEACLSSNVVCHTVPEYSQHQAGIYHNLGVPVGKKKNPVHYL